MLCEDTTSTRKVLSLMEEEELFPYLLRHYSSNEIGMSKRASQGSSIPGEAKKTPGTLKRRPQRLSTEIFPSFSSGRRLPHVSKCLLSKAKRKLVSAIAPDLSLVGEIFTNPSIFAIGYQSDWVWQSDRLLSDAST